MMLIRICLSLVAAGLALAGCAAPPPAEQTPTVTDIRSDMPERVAEMVPPNPAGPRGVASFQRIDLPLDQPTDAAWEIVDESAFPALTRGVWNANGLRIGLLPRSEMPTFIAALPPAVGVSQQQAFVSEYPMPILKTPRLRGYVTVDLTIPPAPVREEDVTGGRLQLLTRLSADHRGVLVLDLLPHHHVPKISLQPRDPLQKELDGRIFEELGLRVDIPPGMALVIGLHRPWPDPEAPTETAATPPVDLDTLAAQSGPDDHGTEVPATQPADDPEAADKAVEAPPKPDEPPLPNHLGRALFAGVRHQRPIQWLLLATIEPLDTAGPRLAPPTEEAASEPGRD